MASTARSTSALSHPGGGVRAAPGTGATIRDGGRHGAWPAASRARASPTCPAGRALPPCASSHASAAGTTIRAIICLPIAFCRRASTAFRDASVAARVAWSQLAPSTHAPALAPLPSIAHWAPITSGWVVDPIRPWVHTHAQRVRHSPFAPRLRHTAMPAGVSPFARSISMSHTRSLGNAQVRSTASRAAYSVMCPRESESATMGSACGGIIQGASSGASRSPPIACQRMAPSSATLRCPSC